MAETRLGDGWSFLAIDDGTRKTSPRSAPNSSTTNRNAFPPARDTSTMTIAGNPITARMSSATSGRSTS
jgi:hypothetical protein